MSSKIAKKKTKKEKKASQAAAAAASAVEQKEDDLDMLEDIKRDEDLYISESDVTNISNFIRTTNKSFNSLGNTVLEKFTGRCSLAILHALLALFDTDSEEREDVIRRLNIIYIVWRLPEMESELRLKAQKNMNDIYQHPFSTFLFYAEQLHKFETEAILARIIVTNNVAMIEKLTAPDFIQKAKNLKVEKADFESWQNYEVANTNHWPEISEEMVSLSKAMRELGCERKDYEAGMAEAFYPLLHNPPTLLPPRMSALEQEDPIMAEYRKIKEADEPKRAADVLYSLNVGDEVQKDIMAAFEEMRETVSEYQAEINSGMTTEELHEAHGEIAYKEEVLDDSDDSENYQESERDHEDTDGEDEKMRKEEMAKQLVTFNEPLIEGCVSRILIGHSLRCTSKSDYMIQFVCQCLITHPQYQRLLIASETDDNIILFARFNLKLCCYFLSRNAMSEQGGNLLFLRYIRIAYKIVSPVQAFDVVMKIATDFYEAGKLVPELKEKVLDFVRNALLAAEEEKNVSARSRRLVAMLVRKLLQGEVVKVEDIAADVKPFCLRNTQSRECTTLYEFITGIQAGLVSAKSDTTSSTSSSSDHITTTTTTTTSVAQNSTTTTTTTTVVKTCGPAMIKQTSRKVVLQASSFKALDKMKKSAQALFGRGSKPTSSLTVTGSLTASCGKTKVKVEKIEEKVEQKEVEHKKEDKAEK